MRHWDAATEAWKRTREGHSSWVRALTFSQDGKALASASSDLTVRLWDATTRAWNHTLDGHRGWVYAVAFSPDGTYISLNDTTVRLWNATTGAGNGHSRATAVGSMLWPSHQMARSLHQLQISDHAVRLWDATTGVQKQAQNQHNYYKSVIFKGRSVSEDWTRVVKSQLWLIRHRSSSGIVNTWNICH